MYIHASFFSSLIVSLATVTCLHKESARTHLMWFLSCHFYALGNATFKSTGEQCFWQNKTFHCYTFWRKAFTHSPCLSLGKKVWNCHNLCLWITTVHSGSKLNFCQKGMQKNVVFNHIWCSRLILQYFDFRDCIFQCISASNLNLLWCNRSANFGRQAFLALRGQHWNYPKSQRSLCA